MKQLLLLGGMVLMITACHPASYAWRQHPPCPYVSCYRKPAWKFMREIAAYYRVPKVEFAPGFPVNDRTIMGRGCINLERLPPDHLAQMLNCDRLRVEYRDTAFYCVALRQR